MQEQHDPITGEVQRGPTIEGEVLNRAADGRLVPHAATTAGEFVNLIEDGQFSADLNQALCDLNAKLIDLAGATGNKQKGSVTITIDFTTEGAVFEVAGKFKVKLPDEKRRKTLFWTDEENRLTRSQPRQGQFFGVRSVPSSGGVRTVG